jgi:ABC-type antimicrobial peptide transport system permease subunit
MPIAYFAASQDLAPGPGITFALRTTGSPAALVPGVKAGLADFDPRYSLRFITLEQQVDNSIRLPRTLGLLSGFFGVLALQLAAFGLYGILSYMLARRRNEIGVRIALGAARTRVTAMVLSDVGRMVAAGIAIGVLLSLALTRFVATFLFGVQPNDLATLSFAALALLAVAVGSTLLPALRAARLDPAAALRHE